MSDEVRARWSGWRLAAALLAFTLLTHAAILATPGFYSHDEWQRVDAIEALGFRGYLVNYAALRVGPDFGYPIRPIGFLEQGIAALWMRATPLVAHLVNVLNHALAVLLFAWVLWRAGVASRVAWLAAALFILSPLTTLATGWVGASFDQLYVVFLLLAAAILVRLPHDALGPRAAAGLAIATTAALLSKETAIVAVAGVPLLAYIARARGRAAFRASPFVWAGLLVAAPVVAYLLYRAPALAGSLAAQGDRVYTPSAAHVAGNAALYFAFPFALRLDDLSGTAATWQIAAALVVHALVVAALRRAFGAWAAVAYLAGYFLFLLPVLFLPARSAHYLYASALPLSLALAALFDHARQRRARWETGLVVACAVLLVVHGARIQHFVYATGACQARFLSSVDTVLSLPREATPLVIVADMHAPLDVAIRAVHDRAPYQRDGRAIVEFERGSRPSNDDARRGRAPARMLASCEVRR